MISGDHQFAAVEHYIGDISLGTEFEFTGDLDRTAFNGEIEFIGEVFNIQCGIGIDELADGEVSITFDGDHIAVGQHSRTESSIVNSDCAICRNRDRTGNIQLGSGFNIQSTIGDIDIFVAFAAVFHIDIQGGFFTAQRKRTAAENIHG